MPSAEATASVRPTGRRQTRLTAIASGKGGVGKTWFAITLAQALRRANPTARVLLVDGDLGLANVDVQLGLGAAVDLAAVFSGRATLTDAICPCVSGGFDVLPGRSGMAGLVGLGRERLEMLLRGLGALPYDDVLLDLGAGIEPQTRLLAARSNLLLVLATDEPTSLTDAYAVLKLHTVDAPAGCARVVINQARSEAEGARTFAALRTASERFLGRDLQLAGIVRRDDRVRDAIRRQTPLISIHPGSPAARDVEALARAIRHTA